MPYRKCIPSVIRKEVMSRQKCEYPGCSQFGCEIHHIKPYALSTDNSTENLLWLCKRHHYICQVFPIFNQHPDSDIICQCCSKTYSTWTYTWLNTVVFHCKACHDRWMQLIWHYKQYHCHKSAA